MRGLVWLFLTFVSFVIFLKKDCSKKEKNKKRLEEKGIDVKKYNIESYSCFKIFQKDFEDLMKEKELIEKIIKLENENF